MRAENDLVCVVIEIDLGCVWVIEIELISVKGSALTWFLCGGRKSLGFSVWIEIDLVFVRGSKLTCFLCAGRN